MSWILCRGDACLVEERSLFLEELDSLPRRRVPDKMAKFLRGTQRKDTDRMLQLKILGREIELRARKKEHFIQKAEGSGAILILLSKGCMFVLLMSWEA
ncbi:hypothetical protein Tco_0631784 [Tanacetum coccineum]